MNFDALVHAIADIHRRAQGAAGRAVNITLTCRNWLIGAYIVEFEQHGEDRAAYGDRLLIKVAERLHQKKVSRSDERELRRFRQFYLAYPQIRDVVSPEFDKLPCLPEKRDSASPDSGLSASLLVNRLSFTHFRLLLEIEDPLKRFFYEVGSIKGNWSVRELRRQIGSLYFERSGLSHDKARLSEIANASAITAEPNDIIRDPYIFEFLGLRVTAASHKELPYFGLINIGDVADFRKYLQEKHGIEVRQDVINDSLFDRISHADSPIHLLIGAKKFIEGWSSWRASSMELLRIGKGEGSQVIQLFGRGVRLKGKDQSLKRSHSLSDAPDWLESLETLCITGWNAD